MQPLRSSRSRSGGSRCNVRDTPYHCTASALQSVGRVPSSYLSSCTLLSCFLSVCADVEAKLAYEKMHALKYARQQDLKQARQQKLAVGKESESLAGQYDARRYEWTKAHEQHLRAEETARTLSAKLEAIEKDKESQRRRAQQQRDELTRCTMLHEQIKRELDIIEASAASV